MHKHPPSLTCLGSSSPKNVAKYLKNIIYPSKLPLKITRTIRLLHSLIKCVLRSSDIHMTDRLSLSDMFQKPRTLMTEQKNPSPGELYDITSGIRLKLDMCA